MQSISALIIYSYYYTGKKKVPDLSFLLYLGHCEDTGVKNIMRCKCILDTWHESEDCLINAGQRN